MDHPLLMARRNKTDAYHIYQPKRQQAANDPEQFFQESPIVGSHKRNPKTIDAITYAIHGNDHAPPPLILIKNPGSVVGLYIKNSKE